MDKSDCTRCSKSMNGKVAYSKSGLVCYPCSVELEKENMRNTGRTSLYLTVHPSPTQCGTRLMPPYYPCDITDWTGTLKFHGGCKQNRHNSGRDRYDAWFIFEGFVWHGLNIGNTQVTNFRRTNEKAKNGTHNQHPSA